MENHHFCYVSSPEGTCPIISTRHIPSPPQVFRDDLRRGVGHMKASTAMASLSRKNSPDEVVVDHKYPLVNVYITMERSTIFNGKTHYFDWAIFNSYVKLPEGTHQPDAVFNVQTL